MPVMQWEDEDPWKLPDIRVGVRAAAGRVKGAPENASGEGAGPHKRKLFGDQSEPAKRPNMLNGYRSLEAAAHPPSPTPSTHPTFQVAPLSNMGNTCYLNSILYTLRFAPRFTHHLHHLAADLNHFYSRLCQTKVKSASLGRSQITGVTLGGCSDVTGGRSASSKDLMTLGNTTTASGSGFEDGAKTKMQIATEKLHELFVTLHSLDMKDGIEPYQPASFLQALTEVNSIYQGNQQQDAHELFIYILDILSSTCDLLAKQASLHPENPEANVDSQPVTNKYRGVRRSWKKQKKPGDYEKMSRKFCGNFVSADFGGVTLRKTKCLECEEVTKRSEPFFDICVPVSEVNFDEDSSISESEFYRQVCVTTENLRGPDKYWCDKCVRYNEAQREVSYKRLPNLLVLQLKRFSNSINGTEKINNYFPSPLVLQCFCDKCFLKPNHSHDYQLYAVIMHLGATMASGHYIAYARISDFYQDYSNCDKFSPTFNTANSQNEKTLNFLKFLKPKNIDGLKNGTLNDFSSNCKGFECCGVKLNRVNNDCSSTNDEQYWLEFDDDVIRTFSTKEFQKLLNCKKNSPATPYLLFYSREKLPVEELHESE